MEHNKGMTLIGMLMTMAIVVFSGLLIIRMVPVYLQYYSINQSIKSLNTIPISSLSGDSMLDVEVLKRSLSKRLDMNGVDDLKPNELVISPDNGYKFKVKLKYQVVKPLLFNISLMFDFDNIQEVIAGSEK